MQLIDWNKEIESITPGETVELLVRDRAVESLGDHCWLIGIMGANGLYRVRWVGANGRTLTGFEGQLIRNVAPKPATLIRYANIYRNTYHADGHEICFHETKELAIDGYSVAKVAEAVRVEITYTPRD